MDHSQDPNANKSKTQVDPSPGYYARQRSLELQQVTLRRVHRRYPRVNGSPITTAYLNREAAILGLVEDARIPHKYLRADLHEVRPHPKHAKVATQLLNMLSEPKLLALCGTNSYRLGKSHIAAAAVWEFCVECRPAMYRTAQDIFMDLKDAYHPMAKKTAKQIQDRLTNLDLLVIDEYQIRSDSPWENNTLRGIIDARYADDRSTILIGNLSVKGFNEYLDLAIAKRIDEQGGFIEADWPKYAPQLQAA